MLVEAASAKDIYTYVAPDGSVVVTDSPTHAQFELWWSDTAPGRTLPNGVPMPKLEGLANLDSYDALFRDAGRAFGVAPELLKAVCVAESRMNPRAVSRAGAQGLMQIMPTTQVALGVTDPFDPGQSIRGGAAYLSAQLRRFDSTELAIAAYNAGPSAVSKAGGVPANRETPTYVARVLGLYAHFRDSRPVGP